MGGSRFAPWTTPLYAALWLAVVIQGWGPLVDRDPVVWLRDPAATAERLTERDLQLSEAIAREAGPTRPLLDRLYGPPEETRSWAIEVHRDLLGHEELLSVDRADAVRRRLAVLLLEAGDEASSEEIRMLLGPDPALEALDASVLASLGLDPGTVERAERVRAAARGDEPARQRAEAALLQRGEPWKRRSLALFATNLGLVVVGGALVGWQLARSPRAWARGLREDGPPPPWSMADGVGVFVRGDFWNRFFFLFLSWAGSLPGGAELAATPAGSLLFTWGSLFASLPLVWLVHRHLLAPAGLGFGRAFGGSAAAAARLAGVALCAIAIDLAGTHAISWSAWGAGVGASWAEGFDEALVWGSRAEAALTAVDYVLWAPALEELAFRGVLYFSLRHRLAPIPAALATAGFFAVLHFYSVPGFGMTLWSGFVWALAFERARSLLPGIAAHAVYNGLFVAGLLLLYR